MSNATQDYVNATPDLFYIAGLVKEKDSDGAGYSVYFPDFPAVCAGGETIEEAIFYANDGLQKALKFLVEDNKPLPKPSDIVAVKDKVKAIRQEQGLDYPENTFYQYFQTPNLETTPVKLCVSIAKGALQEIDRKAKLYGYTRSGFLTKAALEFEPQAL